MYRYLLAGLLFILGTLTGFIPERSYAADVYPSRPITLVVPFPPGGGTDIVARVIAQHLTTRFGWNVVVENRAGASGSIGLKSAANAAPDGYTIVLGQASNLIIDPLYNDKESLVPQLDPIVQTSSFPLVILVDAKSTMRTFEDILSAARQKPGQISFANVGNGSMPHLIALDIEQRTGVSFLHVPYRGNGPAMNDLRAGLTHVFASSSAAAAELAKAGRVHIAAATSLKHSRFFKDSPTISDVIPGYSAVSWHGLLAPKGTPREIIDLINRNVNAVLQDPDLRANFDSQALDVVGGTPEQFQAMLDHEAARWGETVSKVNKGAQK